jgi:hypothetical protein
MSDFLGNLAMKSLGLAPLVQPRPLSPFEALPAEGALAGRLAAERGAEPVEFETESTARPRPAAPRLFHPTPFTSAPFEEARHALTPAFEGARHASRVPLPEAHPAPLRTSQPAALTPAFEGARHASRVSLPAAQPAAFTPVFEGAQHAVPLPAPLSPSPAPPAPERAVAASESQAEPSHGRRALTPVIEQIKASPAPSKTVAAKAESPAERTEPAPTISVTIGRVEVRAAITPRVSPEGRRERRAVLSLDDYLRKRSGGKP